MSDIFISYASEDRARAQVLARELERQNWSVWWDRKTPPGIPFSEWIEHALNEAKCVIVLWSAISVKKGWVKTEAAEGQNRGILVPALIDDVEIPLEFRRIQAANLVDWEAGASHSEFSLLLKAVSAKIDKPVLIKKLESTVDEQDKADVIPGERKDTLKKGRLVSTTDNELLPERDEKTGLKRGNAKTGGKFIKVLPAILMFAVLAVTVFLAISIRKSNIRQEVLARLSNAQTLKGEGNFDKALEDVTEVLTLDPENAQAKSLFNDLTSLINDRDAQQLLSEAEILASNGDYKKAIGLADNLLAEYSDSKYVQQAITNKAAWKKADDEDKRVAQIAFQLSEAQKFKEQDEFDKALEAVAKVFELDPNNAPAKSLRTELTEEKQAYLLWSQAETLASNGDYVEAIEKADTLLTKYSDSKYAQQASAKKIAWQEVLDEKTRITQLLSQAQKFKEQDEFDKALEAVAQVLVLDPDNAQAKSLRNELTNENQAQQLWSQAESLASNGDYVEAIEKADTLLTKYPGSKYAQQASAKKTAWQEVLDENEGITQLLSQAQRFKGQDEFDKALEAVAHVLVLDPENAQAKNLRTELTEEKQAYLLWSQAETLASNGDYKKAIELADRLLAEYSGSKYAQQAQARKAAWKNAHDEKTIEQDFKRFSEAGTNYMSEGNWEEAIKSFTRALATKTNDKGAIDKLVTCQHNLYLSQAQKAESKGDFTTAISLYKKALLYKQVASTQEKLDSAIEALQPPIPVEPQYAKAPLDYGALNHRLVLSLPCNKWVTDACFSPTGDRIASAEEHLVKIWDAMTGTCLYEISYWGLSPLVCFSGDGKIIASKHDKIINIWDTYSGEHVKTIETDHSKHIHDICFSPDGKLIVSASDDKTLKLWDVGSGLFVRAFEGHKNGVFSVDFSPDGKRIASGSWDKTIKLWDADNGDLLKTLKGHSDVVRALVFSQDGNYIAAVDVDNMWVWDIEEEKALVGNSIAPSDIFDKPPLAFSPTGHYLASGDAFGQVHIFDVKSGERVKKFRAYEGFFGIVDINAVGLSPDGKYLLVAADNEYVKVFLFE